ARLPARRMDRAVRPARRRVDVYAQVVTQAAHRAATGQPRGHDRRRGRPNLPGRELDARGAARDRSARLTVPRQADGARVDRDSEVDVHAEEGRQMTDLE